MVDLPETDNLPTIPRQAAVSLVGLAAIALWVALGLTTDDVVAFANSDAMFPTTLGLFVLALAVLDWRRQQN